MTPIYSETYAGYDIRIIPDDHAELSNTDGDNDTFLVSFHRQFFVSTPRVQRPEAIYAMRKTHHIFLLEAYIHSGVVLALAGSSEAESFPDRRWDVSLLGAVFISKRSARSRNKARKHAQALIELWNDYLAGRVYAYEVFKDGALVERIGDYYGDYDADGGALPAARELIESWRRKKIIHDVKETENCIYQHDHKSEPQLCVWQD